MHLRMHFIISDKESFLSHEGIFLLDTSYLNKIPGREALTGYFDGQGTWDKPQLLHFN